MLLRWNEGFCGLEGLLNSHLVVICEFAKWTEYVLYLLDLLDCRVVSCRIVFDIVYRYKWRKRLTSGINKTNLNC